MTSDELRRQGIGPDNYWALGALPALYCAWVDGIAEKLTRAHVDAIVAAVASELPRAAVETIRRWLIHGPPVAPGKFAELIYRGEQQHGDLYVQYGEVQSLLIHGEGMTRAAAEAFDVPFNVSPPRQQALLEMVRCLGIESGASWDMLLEQLGLPPRPKSPVPAKGRLSPKKVAQKPSPKSLRAVPRRRLYGRPMRRFRTAIRGGIGSPKDPSGGLA